MGEMEKLLSKFSEQQVILRNLENDNTQLREELCEARNSLNQNTGHVKEIVRNVLKIKQLQEELENEKQKNGLKRSEDKQEMEKLLSKFSEQQVILRNLENDNTQLGEEPCEARHSLNQNTGQVQ